MKNTKETQGNDTIMGLSVADIKHARKAVARKIVEIIEGKQASLLSVAEIIGLLEGIKFSVLSDLEAYVKDKEVSK